MFLSKQKSEYLNAELENLLRQNFAFDAHETESLISGDCYSNARQVHARRKLNFQLLVSRGPSFKLCNGKNVLHSFQDNKIEYFILFCGMIAMLLGLFLHFNLNPLCAESTLLSRGLMYDELLVNRLCIAGCSLTGGQCVPGCSLTGSQCT